MYIKAKQWHPDSMAYQKFVDNVPLRPIVSAIGLAKHLTFLLQPYIGQTETYVRDSTHFISKIKDLVLDENDILIELRCGFSHHESTTERYNGLHQANIPRGYF